MAVCSMGFEHEDSSAETNEADVATEAVAADATVQVAQIEANRDVTIAKLAAKTEVEVEESRVAQLEAEIRGMLEILSQIVPPAPEPVEESAPAPEPVVVDAPAPEVEAPPAAEEHRESKPKPKRGLGAW